MSYSIRNTRNTETTVVANNTLQVTTFGIRIPGRNFAGYGEAIGQSLLHIVENFACPNNGSDIPNPTNPSVDLSSPVEGQLWFDTTDVKLRVWDGSSWVISSGAAAVGTAPPGSPIEGDLWWNENTNQLFGYDSTAWILVGPDNPATQINKLVNLRINSGGTGGLTSGTGVLPTGGTTTNAIGMLVGNVLVGVWSNDEVASPTYYFNPLNNGTNNVVYYNFDPFETNGILRGLNIGENTGSNFWFNGKAKSSESADAVAGLSSTTFMRNDNAAGADVSRRPSVAGTLDIGASTARWNNMFANVFNGTATSARYSDIAERYEADKPYTPGTVVMLGGDKEITETTLENSTDVFGVVSTNPAYMMNRDAGSDSSHPYIALSGRLPVKVIGKVKKGDRLVSSNVPGVAKADTPTSVFSVIGRALENKNTDEEGVIEAVVGKN